MTLAKNPIEWKKHLSESLKACYRDPEYRKKRLKTIVKINRTMALRYPNGSPSQSPDARVKRSASLKKFYIEHPEARLKHTEQGRRLQASGLAHRSQKGDFEWTKTPEFRQKVREKTLQVYAEHPEIIDKIREARAKQKFPFIDSSIEKRLKNGLDKIRVPYQAQYIVHGASIIDIALPEKKIAIYCDGNYWHSLPKTIKRDIKSNASLSEQGWTVLRFREDEINDNLGDCLAKIEVLR